jgi:peptide/nickel transport system permease protein
MKIPLTLKKLFRRRIVLAAGICLLIVVAVALAGQCGQRLRPQ